MSSGRPRAISSVCADLPPLPSASLALFSKTPALSPPRPQHVLRSRAARVAISALAAVALALAALCLLRGSSPAPLSPPASAASAHLPLASDQPASPSARGSAPRFFLYRMIGNDMPPLQCDGQLYLNTLYALQHEPKDLPDLRRIWVMNKMLNDTEEARITAAILAHGYSEEVRAGHVVLLAARVRGACGMECGRVRFFRAVLTAQCSRTRTHTAMGSMW
ncbi:unnamed protein product [Closterium sp. NIES-53]